MENKEIKDFETKMRNLLNNRKTKMENKPKIYFLYIHELSNNKKVITDIDKHLDLEKKISEYKSEFYLEGTFSSLKELNDYYNRYFNL